MRKVLLLNGNGDVLNFIPWTRAISLVLKGKVTVYEEFEDEVRSQHRSFRIPAVIGLLRMVPFKYSGKVSLSKQNLLIRDRHECQYCGRALSVHNATVDHIVPVSRGGRRVWKNVVACLCVSARRQAFVSAACALAWIPTGGERLTRDREFGQGQRASRVSGAFLLAAG